MDSSLIFKQHRGGIVTLEPSEIVYIQVVDKYINIYTGTDKYYIRSSLNEYMRTLEGKFIRISRNVVVNFDNVSWVQDGEVKVNNGERLSVSRRRWKEVNAAFRVYLGEKMTARDKNRPFATKFLQYSKYNYSINV